MAGSILEDIKKMCSVAPDDDSFDAEFILHINSVLSTLEQVGIGMEGGFWVDDAAATWDEFIGVDPRFNAVKGYVFLRVKILFDPPQTAHLLSAYERQIKELEWRLNVASETNNPTILVGFGVGPFGTTPFGT